MPNVLALCLGGYSCTSGVAPVKCLDPGFYCPPSGKAICPAGKYCAVHIQALTQASFI